MATAVKDVSTESRTPAEGGTSPTLHRTARTASWIAQLAAAAILGQTLFYKFTGAAEAVALFETLGAEPWGRFAVGAAELATVLLLLTPRMAGWGGVAAVGLMVGAVLSHIAWLGIEVNGDGGALFFMALAVLATGSFVGWLRRKELLRAASGLIRK